MVKGSLLFCVEKAYTDKSFLDAGSNETGIFQESPYYGERNSFMSQKKVDQYKKYKSGKEAARKHEKKMARLEAFLATVIAVAFIGWFAYSIYDTATHPASDGTSSAAATQVDMNDYANYVSELQNGYSS